MATNACHLAHHPHRAGRGSHLVDRREIDGGILLLILSVFFAYLVSPLVDFLRRPVRLSGKERVMPRVLAISLAYLIIVGAIVVAFYVLLPRLGNQFPEFAQQARGYWKSLGESMQRFNEYFRLRMPGPVMDAINREIPHSCRESATRSVHF